jgi:hypothetical protein
VGLGGLAPEAFAGPRNRIEALGGDALAAPLANAETAAAEALQSLVDLSELRPGGAHPELFKRIHPRLLPARDELAAERLAALAQSSFEQTKRNEVHATSHA